MPPLPPPYDGQFEAIWQLAATAITDKNQDRNLFNQKQPWAHSLNLPLPHFDLFLNFLAAGFLRHVARPERYMAMKKAVCSELS